nr:uncharacterized protein LOC127315752 [Lolium perenne]
MPHHLHGQGAPRRPAAAPPRPAAPLAGPPGSDLARSPTTAGALARPAGSSGRARPQPETRSPEISRAPLPAPVQATKTPATARLHRAARGQKHLRARRTLPRPSTPPRRPHAAAPAVLEPRPSELPLTNCHCCILQI